MYFEIISVVDKNYYKLDISPLFITHEIKSTKYWFFEKMCIFVNVLKYQNPFLCIYWW